MPRYKHQERHGLLLPVVLSEQIVPGSFAFALDYLVDHELVGFASFTSCVRPKKRLYF